MALQIYRRLPTELVDHILHFLTPKEKYQINRTLYEKAHKDATGAILILKQDSYFNFILLHDYHFILSHVLNEIDPSKLLYIFRFYNAQNDQNDYFDSGESLLDYYIKMSLETDADQCYKLLQLFKATHAHII